ncbi:hypothetical protein GCM10022631_11360 [Deinococcus rubellus]|uniref:hypothetical protein n=1 Tax=Deinococcus rubellus TaxID=1889240 RepID=UPI0031E7E11A
MTDLLVMGEQGRAPLLLLFGVVLTQDALSAQGYTVRYKLPEGPLHALEHDNPQDKNWVLLSPGITVIFPAHDAGHHIHTPITLKRVMD